MNQVRTLHEATQLALKGHKVLVSCPCVDPALAESLISGIATTFLLYFTPRKCTHEPNGPGWAVRFRSQGEVFFSPFYSQEDRYFDYYFTLRPVEDIRSDLVDKGLPIFPVPLEWDPAIHLTQEPVCVLNRYKRIQAKLRSLWDTSQ